MDRCNADTDKHTNSNTNANQHADTDKHTNSNTNAKYFKSAGKTRRC
jgi:hypothetical protein